jgi:3-oxoacyl-[acyl-carrier-protein] synthase III
VGTGYELPERIRGNDDPIFAWLHENHPDGMKLFQGYDQRRVLRPGQTAVGMGTGAARKALASAGVDVAGIDVIAGFVSVSDHQSPNGLGEIHRDLGLSSSAMVLPVNNEFNNFNACLLLGAGLIDTGAADRVLVVCSGDWTQHVSYRTPQSVSAADGAGAVVLARTDDPTRFAVLDTETVVDTGAFGTMYMSADELARPAWGSWGAPEYGVRTGPYFHITPEGVAAFQTFGMDAPPRAAGTLLERAGLRGKDVTLVSHQASTVLMDHWSEEIAPGRYLSTIDTFGNLTVANIPVTLAWGYDRIDTDHLLLLGIGVEMQTNALLLGRGRQGSTYP